MSVFLALLHDAYRELNARKLFWITLAISGIVVFTYASIGFNESGVSMLFGFKQIDSEYLNSGSRWARALYMGIFSDFIVTIWLSWVAVILALISTCTIFPDFLAGGAIDVVLSKPIHRVTLFAMKYLSSLLFVVLQVTLFCVGIFLCVGWRLGEWNWTIFAAIPLVTIFFSYLYSMSVLTAVLTRSAITSLLLTLLFWFSLWGVQTAEGSLKQFRIRFQVVAETAQSRIDRIESNLAELDDPDNPAHAAARADVERRLEDARREKADADNAEAALSDWHGPVETMLFVLPKTGQTIGLLSRWLKDPDGLSITAMMRGDMSGSGSSTFFPDKTDVEMTRRLEAQLDEVPIWYIIGTSLCFEAVVLGAACVVFVRRDF